MDQSYTHSLKSETYEEVTAKFHSVATIGKQRCHKFIELVFKNCIEGKGEESPDVTENQRKNFLEYLFGFLVKDVATE